MSENAEEESYKIIGIRNALLANVMQNVVIHSCVPSCDRRRRRLLNALPLFLVIIGFGLVAGYIRQFLVQIPLVSVAHLLHKLFGDNVFCDQFVCIQIRHRLPVGNQFVNGRIGERRIIQFVVAPSAEAHEIDEHILVEFALVIECQTCDVCHRLRIIAIHMENRRVDAFGQIGAVARRSASITRRCESHLIVDNHVNCSADIEVRCASHHQHFLIDALTGESGVTMQLYIQHARSECFRTGERTITIRLLL